MYLCTNASYIAKGGPVDVKLLEVSGSNVRVFSRFHYK